ncbi:phage integrase SAM-like domain-containing protein [Autumnicola musiva]|uniref:phage integrase SAM-like domain-containing protein n=1 Tax=Autumnicola musiva TaxID=3075589 RepID=UPI003D787B3C
MRKSLKDLFQYHNQHSDHLLSKATISHYKTTQKYLFSYIVDVYNRRDFCLKDLDYSFIVGFETYLRNIDPARHQNKMTYNGAMKHIQRYAK